MTSSDPRLLIGDAATTLATLPAASVDMVLTSPPYANGLRDYGVAGQLGNEATVQEWVDDVLAALTPLERVLKPDGTLWLNVGDSYSRTPGEGAPRKSLLLGPERLALAMIERGWLLRNKVVWAKPNGLPTAVTDRLRNKWEVVYVFARTPKYFFDLDAVRVPHLTRPPRRRESLPARTRPDTWQGRKGDRGDGLQRLRARGRVGHDLGSNPGDVWLIPVSAWNEGTITPRFRSPLQSAASGPAVPRASVPDAEHHGVETSFARSGLPQSAAHSNPRAPA
ncbi:hypothetical protein QE377_001008 [Microbacterium sp. SORGH_AS 862]|nr:site-specific DNA-methyltransferase [Microbacterium sp. SORGH_AS_0862]MDQ1204649.1 hypothetical protein [Microbacterium sp. SORGH_AS_0862]